MLNQDVFKRGKSWWEGYEKRKRTGFVQLDLRPETNPTVTPFSGVISGQGRYWREALNSAVRFHSFTWLRMSLNSGNWSPKFATQPGFFQLWPPHQTSLVPKWSPDAGQHIHKDAAAQKRQELRRSKACEIAQNSVPSAVNSVCFQQRHQLGSTSATGDLDFSVDRLLGETKFFTLDYGEVTAGIIELSLVKSAYFKASGSLSKFWIGVIFVIWNEGSLVNLNS